MKRLALAIALFACLAGGFSIMAAGRPAQAAVIQLNPVDASSGSDSSASSRSGASDADQANDAGQTDDADQAGSSDDGDATAAPPDADNAAAASSSASASASDAESTTYDGLTAAGVVLVCLVMLAIWLLPAIIAFSRGHTYKWIILLLSVLGPLWLVAAVWAAWPRDKSLIDPVAGNVTGLGSRNAGDTLGAVEAAKARGYGAESLASQAAPSQGGYGYGSVPLSPSPRPTIPPFSAGPAPRAAAPEPPAPPAAARSRSIVDIETLERLASLHKSGVLTDAEFAEQKRILLQG